MLKVRLLLIVLLWTPGCTLYNVSFPGKLVSRPQSLGAEGGGEPWGILALDQLGNLTLNGQHLRLPYAYEDRRFGVGFAATANLPRVFRPRHAADGGLMVAALERTSPLAIAGLRPFDVVRTFNGTSFTRAADLTSALGRLQPGETARLDVLTPRGPASVEAQAAEDLHASTSVHLILFDFEKGRTAYSFGLGPFTLLFYRWRAVNAAYDFGNAMKDETITWPRHVETRYWRFLSDIVEHWHSKDLATGREKSRLKLFWFIRLGDWKENAS